MSSLYSAVAQMLVNWSGADATRRPDAEVLAREIVDAVVNSIRENGFAMLHLAAAHDSSEPD